MKTLKSHVLVDFHINLSPSLAACLPKRTMAAAPYLANHRKCVKGHNSQKGFNFSNYSTLSRTENTFGDVIGLNMITLSIPKDSEKCSKGLAKCSEGLTAF
jgi:hypothetical protein